jgi:archaetidylserine synthase
MNAQTRGAGDSEGLATPTPGGLPQRSILVFLNDLANLLTLAGLLCGVLGIYFAARGQFPAAMIAMLWAVLFDWFDGPVARRTPGRSDDFRSFGGSLDSLTDIVGLCICPVVVLLSYGEFSAWFLPGAFALAAAGAVRLSYFNVYGLEGDKAYVGLPLDINVLILTCIFLIEGFVSRGVFTVLLYVSATVLATLNVSPLRVPKMGGLWYYIITAYVVVLTAVYGFRLAT